MLHVSNLAPSAMTEACHLDPYMPLAADGLHFHRIGEAQWKLATGRTLDSLLKSAHPPEFRTILACDNDFSREMTMEGIHAVKYHGPMYMDLDGETLDEVCVQFRKLLAKLAEMRLDLSTVRVFATGGRGFHLEIPAGCFMGKVPASGMAQLPAIYREMAHLLYVDTVDMRVYSAKRGRMWRVPNRKRSNGNFKVPITGEEAKGITPEMYRELVSAPRPFPPLTAPVFCPRLAQIFTEAREKVGVKVARKARASANDGEFRRRFGGRLPPSLAALGAGRFPARGGWNQICLQISLAAHACGVDEDALIDACRGLVDSHVSDGTRYNSPRKREEELRGMFSYVASTPSYEASAAGLRAILPRGIRCTDLRGL